MNDAELDSLLRRAQSRDEAALTRVVEHFAPRVYGLLRRLAPCSDVVEDLVQETFVRVVRTIEDYQHDGRFCAWLFQIAANVARDHARRVRRAGAHAPPEPRAVDDVEPSALARLAAEETRDELRRALDELGETDREILLLRHYGDLSFQQIADLLQVPLGTALARAHRAVKRLRAQMEARE